MVTNGTSQAATSSKSQAVSMSGVLMSFIHSLVKHINAAGANDADSVLRWLTTPEGEVVVRTMACLAVERKDKGCFIYRYRVDGDKSVDDLVQLGDYDNWEDVVEAEFTIGDKTVRSVDAILIPCAENVTALEASSLLGAMRWMGFFYSDWRVADTEEFLCFGAQNPDAQRHNTIVCVGATGIKHNQTACLVLDSFVLRSQQRHRALRIESQTKKWPHGTKFLLIRKQS